MRLAVGGFLFCSLHGCAGCDRAPARGGAEIEAASLEHSVETDDPILTDEDFEEPPQPPAPRRWSERPISKRYCATAAQARRIRCAEPKETEGPPLRIGVVQLSPRWDNPKKIVLRLQEIFADQAIVRLLPPTHDSLDNLDIVALPSGWAQYSWAEINARAQLYRAFVEAGGGLLMFQPNPHEFRGEAATVTLLAPSYSVENSYHDHCVVAVVPHPVLCGLHPSELPYPADRIVDFEEPWQLLARGGETGHGSLLVAEIGKGRAVVDSDNCSARAMVSQRQNVTHSDELLRRLVLWLAHRLK